MPITPSLDAGLRHLLTGLALGTLMSTLALSQEARNPARLAVVIGNQDYAEIPDLGNARHDAERMADLLRTEGFTVFDAYDIDRRGFEDLLRTSILNVSDGAEIVFFYAGHGLQIGRRNYLLPVDVAFDSIYDLPVESVTLDRVIEVLSARGEVHVAIIDACRDNPFPDKMMAGNLDASLFETRSGFDAFQTPLNSLVAFSTAPGMVAFDGQGGENSPYTAAILAAVDAYPDDDILSVFARVRENVYKTTKGKQVPWESSTLVQPFRLRKQGVPTPPVLLAAAEPAQEGASSETRTASEPATLPAAVTITAIYDRDVPLTAALTRALNLTEALDFAVTTPPSDGTLSVADNGMIYRPRLSERRATTRQIDLSDSFTLTFDLPDGPAPVTVSLDMEANGCDLAAGDALDPGGVGFYRLPNEIEIVPALAECRAAVSQNPDTPRFRYQLGRAEQAAGLFKASFDSFSAAADAGHIRALNGTARLLITDKIDRAAADIAADPTRAMALYDRGIAAGDPYAMHSKGLHLLRNSDTDQGRQDGFELLDRAAELGHTYSMNELGIYFLTPDTEHFLPERGMRYLRASAARNDIYGYFNLGFVAQNGLTEDGIDLAAAYDWFVKAADGGHPIGPAALGRMIVNGQVPGQGPQQAVAWYDKGLARGDGWGGVNAAALILNGTVQGQTRTSALIRLAKARHLSNTKASETAAALLADQPPKELALATQTLLVKLGATMPIDGAIGPMTRRILDRMAQDHGLPPASNDRLSELETAARIYWAERPTRPDLF